MLAEGGQFTLVLGGQFAWIFHLESTIKLITGHEFRTPLNGIVGFAELLSNPNFKINPNEQIEFSKHILQSANRLKSLSERLMIWFNLSHLEANIEKKTSITSNWVESIILKQALANLPNWDLFKFSASADSWNVQGDLSIIKYAIDELINNAFKFSVKGSVVTIEIKANNHFLDISFKNSSDYLTAAMMEDYVVFKQFNRDKMEQQGLGLGVEIAKLAVQKCGGTLLFKSESKEKDNWFTVFARIKLVN